MSAISRARFYLNGVAIGVAWVQLYGMIYFGSKLNSSMQGYITKFMGLLVMGMGVQFVLEGIRSFFFETVKEKNALLEVLQQVWVYLG